MVETVATYAAVRAVRKVRAEELAELAAVLARAFYDDPPTKWVLQDDSRRMEMLERGFTFGLRRLWLAQEECYTTEGVAGGAIWELPGRWHLSPLKQLQLLPGLARIYGRVSLRLLRANLVAESNHPKQPHYYLFFLGVDPKVQGRGIGSALMQPVLERCDRERTPAYLEASTPRTRALYERHGFAVTEEFTLGKGSPPVWRMWRDPALSTMS